MFLGRSAAAEKKSRDWDFSNSSWTCSCQPFSCRCSQNVMRCGGNVLDMFVQGVHTFCKIARILSYLKAAYVPSLVARHPHDSRCFLHFRFATLAWLQCSQDSPRCDIQVFLMAWICFEAFKAATLLTSSIKVLKPWRKVMCQTLVHLNCREICKTNVFVAFSQLRPKAKSFLY